jgi:hypothetical protein
LQDQQKHEKWQTKQNGKEELRNLQNQNKRARKAQTQKLKTPPEIKLSLTNSMQALPIR